MYQLVPVTGGLERLSRFLEGPDASPSRDLLGPNGKVIRVQSLTS